MVFSVSGEEKGRETNAKSKVCGCKLLIGSVATSTVPKQLTRLRINPQVELSTQYTVSTELSFVSKYGKNQGGRGQRLQMVAYDHISLLFFSFLKISLPRRERCRVESWRLPARKRRNF